MTASVTRRTGSVSPITDSRARSNALVEESYFRGSRVPLGGGAAQLLADVPVALGGGFGIQLFDMGDVLGCKAMPARSSRSPRRMAAS
jgi:hypothetical protein